MTLPKMRKRQRFGTREEQQVRCPGHLAWIRRHECCIKGRNGHACDGRIEAMHVRYGNDGGAGIKPGDDHTIPGCTLAHRTQHDMGELSFQHRYGIDLNKMADQLWQMSPHRKKYENAR